jgi:hypothetical protein
VGLTSRDLDVSLAAHDIPLTYTYRRNSAFHVSILSMGNRARRLKRIYGPDLAAARGVC